MIKNFDSKLIQSRRIYRRDGRRYFRGRTFRLVHERRLVAAKSDKRDVLEMVRC